MEQEVKDMRLELQFDLDKPEVNLDYRRLILSWLKAGLTRCNQGKYYERYFGGTEQKDYSFTVLLGRAKFTREKIYLPEPKMKVIFSADNRHKTGLIFYSSFLGMKNNHYPLPEGNAMTLRRVSQKREQLINESTSYFQTCLGNGLCIREHDRETNRDRFITYKDSDFREKAIEILKYQASMAGFPESILKGLSIEPVQCKKVLVYFYKRYIDVSVGIFKMHGNPDVLQYFYEAGMCSKKSAGFGQVNILRQGEAGDE